MISRFKENKHYSRNIKISFIFSELLIICVFLFSPEINYKKSEKYSEPLIFIDDIPVTIQSARITLKKPKTPAIFIGEEIDEPDILDNIVLSNTDKQELSGSNNVTAETKLINGREQSAPRQLLEFLPDKKNINYSGSIKLKLKIDSSGKVAEYIILYNSIDCEDCLKEIISAVYKSLWKPARKNGSETEFWVEKSYTFN